MNKMMTMLKVFMINIYYTVRKIFRNIIKGKSKFTTHQRENKPIFTSSFIQKWYSKDFTLDRWIDELRMLKDVGINEIILQSVIDTKEKYAVYPTEMKGYTTSENDMILLALEAGKITKVKIRIGLAENDEWWKRGYCDYDWLIEEAEINKKIINEIYNKYGFHEAFRGWYISYEFSELFATTKLQRRNLNLFYKVIAYEIKCRSGDLLDIMIAPFYSSNKLKAGDMENWRKILEDVLENTGIDIVALQDSVGAGFNTVDVIGELFYYTKQATDTLEIKLYADTETFNTSDEGNISAVQEEILQRMSKVNPYVEEFTAFSINHFQNRNVENQRENYEAYLKYYSEE